MKIKLIITGILSVLILSVVYPYLYILLAIFFARILPPSIIWSNEFTSKHLGEFSPMNKRYACEIAKNEWVGKKGRTIYVFTGDHNSIETLFDKEPKLQTVNDYFSSTVYIYNQDNIYKRVLNL